MAKQSGLYKLQGLMDGVIHAKTENGYIAYMRRAISPERLETDPKFARFRENKTEFARASTGGKLIRSAFPPYGSEMADKKVTWRLLKQLITIIQSDPINDKGMRTLPGGDLKMLEGFDLNIHAEFTTVFTKPFTVTADPATGAADLHVEGFIPVKSIEAPPKTTHFRLVMGAACLDFENNKHESADTQSDYIPYDRANTELIALRCSLKHAPATPMAVVLGIQFSKFVNGKHYSLQESNYAALRIVKVAV